MTWDLKTGNRIPATHTFTWKEGVRLGGLVVDPEGWPVAGAEVSLHRFWKGMEDSREEQGEQTGFTSQKRITTKEGRWVAEDRPGEWLHSIEVKENR